MSGFVIEYNRHSQDWRLTEYPGPDGSRRALLRRLELEVSRPTKDWEIAALASDSVATLRETHARYFRGTQLAANAVL